MSYVPLWCKSNFSFLEGASHPEELVEQAHTHGLRSLALTDRDGIYGVVRAHVKAQELGVHLIVGAEVTVRDPICPSTCILLALNSTGYTNLCRLITVGRLRSPKGGSSVVWSEIFDRSEGLIALWGGDRSALVCSSHNETQKQGLQRVISQMRDAFSDRLYAIVCRHRRTEEVQQEECLRRHAERADIPLVAANEVLYHTPARRNLHDVVTCIRHGVTLATAGRCTRPNAEHDLKTPRMMTRLFANEALLLDRTKDIAARCTFTLSEIRYRYPSERLPDGKTSSTWLRELTLFGAAERFRGAVPRNIREQIEKELSLIEELDYGGYFLTMWEIVQYCRQEDILCQGRGSAANSVVCYCLGITAVDPTRVELLFERFLSRERHEPPDIDLDIMHGRREEVIQHVYKKYGRSHAAMVANVVRYRPRSAVRDVGKVLGMSATSTERFAKMLSHSTDRNALRSACTELESASLLRDHFLQLTAELENFPRHLSIHPGGFLLGHKPVHDLVPVENATMADRTVIQWDKSDLEALGLFKVDLLGLGALTQLDIGFRLLQTHYRRQLSLDRIPQDDPETYDQICQSDTVGVFQIESRAQMAMLPRLRPRHYYDLVIEVSIVRPGPITGDMVHPFLRRRNGEEPVIYPHRCLEPVLRKTLGVPLFQEQVMKLAVVAADYTPGEADQLRRDMAAWYRSGRIERHQERLVTRMMAKGITKKFAERVFEQIRGFGEYGFPESHAASFALIAYATAWLRCHYPDVFICALLNAQPMGFYSPATIVEDASRHGIEIYPIDVTVSEWDCTLEPISHNMKRHNKTQRRFGVRMGLRYVKSLSKDRDWQPIAVARAEQPFTAMTDFVRRTGLGDRKLRRLAEVGAFAAFEADRRSALWQVQGFGTLRNMPLPISAEDRLPAFRSLSKFQAINWDYQFSGHSTHGHPLEPLREMLMARGLPNAEMVLQMRDGQRVNFAGIVICRQRPSTASGVTFMTLEDESGFLNIVIWKQVFEEHLVLVKTASFLGVSGKLQIESQVTHLIAEQFWLPELMEHPETGGSRDFQ